MVFFVFYLLEAAVLALALSLDTFAAGISLGARRIRIPAASLLALSLTCSLSLLVSILLGGLLGDWISPHAANLISCMLLCGIGGVRLLTAWSRACCAAAAKVNAASSCAFKISKSFCRSASTPPRNTRSSVPFLSGGGQPGRRAEPGRTGRRFWQRFFCPGRVSILVFLLSLLCNLLAVLAGCNWDSTSPAAPRRISAGLPAGC